MKAPNNVRRPRVVPRVTAEARRRADEQKRHRAAASKANELKRVNALLLMLHGDLYGVTLARPNRTTPAQMLVERTTGRFARYSTLWQLEKRRLVERTKAGFRLTDSGGTVAAWLAEAYGSAFARELANLPLVLKGPTNE